MSAWRAGPSKSWPGCWIEPTRSEIALEAKPKPLRPLQKHFGSTRKQGALQRKLGSINCATSPQGESGCVAACLRNMPLERSLGGAESARQLLIQRWTGSRGSNWSLENTRRVMARSFMRFTRACRLPVPARAFSIANDSFSFQLSGFSCMMASSGRVSGAGASPSFPTVSEVRPPSGASHPVAREFPWSF